MISKCREGGGGAGGKNINVKSISQSTYLDNSCLCHLFLWLSEETKQRKNFMVIKHALFTSETKKKKNITLYSICQRPTYLGISRRAFLPYYACLLMVCLITG